MPTHDHESRSRSFPGAVSLLALCLFLAGTSYADFTGKGHVHTLSETQQVFLNPDCRPTDSCDLKRFALTHLVNEIWFSDDPDHPTYANGVIMEYETGSIAAIEKYAIVQFKKGCVFYSSKDKHGKIHRQVGDRVQSFGESTPFCFADWVIDSQDTDPVYNSDPEYGRFYLLRWNRPGSYDQRTQKYYGAEKPKRPVVYMTDFPAGAFVGGSGIRNVALEFKTCIYKARDLPAATRRDDINLATPIGCFEWQSIYVYDFARRQFQTRLTGVPWWKAPERRIDVRLLALFAALLGAVALFAVAKLSKILRRKTDSAS